MRKVSRKRQGWLKDYHKVLQAWTPEECARCGRRGSGWTNFGGDLEPHHIMGRRTHAAMCLVLPLCSDCHRGFCHAREKTAVQDGWLIKRTVSKFDRDVMDASSPRSDS